MADDIYTYCFFGLSFFLIFLPSSTFLSVGLYICHVCSIDTVGTMKEEEKDAAR